MQSSFFSGLFLPSWQQSWHILGWTMLYFLAAGTFVLLIGAMLRISLRRANPRVRYATSLAVFAVLALLPVAIASWLTITQTSHQQPEFTTNLTNRTNEMASRERKRPEITTEVTEDTEGKKSNEILHREAESVSVEFLLNSAVSYLPWVWVIGTPLTFLLLASGLVGAERLRRSCAFLSDGPLHESCKHLRIALGIGRMVGIAICERVATPLLVGVVRPLILLPPAALNGWTTEELEMVLLHELAHVRRWDNAVNLAQRLVESLLFFHPAVWIVSTWVRRDREDCCDAVVVGHTAKPQAYAELLLALASHQPLAGLAASAFARHPVAVRIRRILKLEDEPMLVSRKALTFVASAAVALVLLACFLAPSEAQQASRERPEKKLNAENAESTDIIGVTHARIYQIVPVVVENDPLWKETQKTIIRSHPVLSRILDDPNISKLPLMKHAQPNPLQWLSEHMNVNFTSEGKMLLGLTGPRSEIEDLREVAQAVVRSYLYERKKLQAQRESLFPTLEDQRAADIAYKLLGVELEKLSDEELKRVKAKGYKGGLKVASQTVGNNFPGIMPIQGDLLVGLHVWPTESLDQVNEILSRDDLDKLTPLKFYVIRAPGSGVGSANDENHVTTGRIQVDLDAWRQIREQQRISSVKPYLLQIGDVIRVKAFNTVDEPMKLIDDTFAIESDGTVNLGTTFGKLPLAGKTDAEALPLVKKRLLTKVRGCEVMLNLVHRFSPVETTASTSIPPEASSESQQPPPLYDGKTFEEWRELWKAELKTEKRTECINALAAFGRAGKGKEAAAAILDVAGEYDFTVGEYGFGSSAEGELKKSVLEMLVSTQHSHLAEREWLPLLKERLDKESAKYKWLGYILIVRLNTNDAKVRPILLDLQKNTERLIRQAALAAILGSRDIFEDDEKKQLVQATLREDALTALNVSGRGMADFRGTYLLNLIEEDQLLAFLVSEQDEVQVAARKSIQGIYEKEKGARLANALVAILKDQEREQDHLAAVRALAALHYHAVGAEPHLNSIIESTTDEEMLIAAVHAREQVTLKERHFRITVSDESRAIVEKSGLWQKLIDDNDTMQKKLSAENTKATEQQPMGGGMGGGF